MTVTEPGGKDKREAAGILVPGLSLIKADITTVPADFLVTCVGTDGNWNGSIDRVLKRLTSKEANSHPSLASLASQTGFHPNLDSAARRTGLREGDLHIVPSAIADPKSYWARRKGGEHYSHIGISGTWKFSDLPFDAVAFIMDDLTDPLSTVIPNGLKVLDEGIVAVRGQENLPFDQRAVVTVPLIRTGSRRSAFEQTPEAAVASLAEGINTFRRNGARGIREIKVLLIQEIEI